MHRDWRIFFSNKLDGSEPIELSSDDEEIDKSVVRKRPCRRVLVSSDSAARASCTPPAIKFKKPHFRPQSCNCHCRDTL